MKRYSFNYRAGTVRRCGPWPLRTVGRCRPVNNSTTQSLKISLATLPQNNPDNNKNNDGADATPAQFVGSVPSNKSTKYIVHNKKCLKSDAFLNTQSFQYFFGHKLVSQLVEVHAVGG